MGKAKTNDKASSRRRHKEEELNRGREKRNTAMHGAREIKLLPHRWAMHAIDALARHDHALLHRVWTELRELPPHAIDTQVQAHGYGAPFSLADYGFFDAQSPIAGDAPAHSSRALLQRVMAGDTLLLLALREDAPQCVHVLLSAGASMDLANASKESAWDRIYALFAAHQQRITTDASTERKYDAVFTMLHDRLVQQHDQIKTQTTEQLTEIYTRVAPERLTKIPQQMREFAFREPELLALVQQKYLAPAL